MGGPDPEAQPQGVRDDVRGFTEPVARAGAGRRFAVGLGYLIAESTAEAGRVQAQQYGVHEVAASPVTPRRLVASRAVAAIRSASAASAARPGEVSV